MCKKLSYYSVVDHNKSPGIIKKIENTVRAANAYGIESFNRCYPNSLKGNLFFLWDLLKDDSEIIIIRFFDRVFPFVFIIMLIKRLFGSVFIIDVPTPRIIALKELDVAPSGLFKKNVRKFFNYLMGGIVLWPANRVVQYADESAWFSFGLKDKTIKMGNGIWIDNSIPLSNIPLDSRSELNLIGVAQLANWHGYDRLIHALSIFNKRYPEER